MIRRFIKSGALVASFLCMVIPRFTFAETAESLRTVDASKRQQVVRDLISQRKETIGSLISILADPNSDRRYRGLLHTSAYLCGEYRAVEAVKPLIAILDFVPTGYEVEETEPREHRYVAALALTQIGSPCLPDVAEIVKSPSDKRHAIASWVVLKVLGKDFAVAYLKTVVTTNEVEKAGIESALGYITTYKPVYGPSK